MATEHAPLRGAIREWSREWQAVHWESYSALPLLGISFSFGSLRYGRSHGHDAENSGAEQSSPHTPKLMAGGSGRPNA